jgi:membrane-bound serine protease (ClpP class)
MKKLLLLLSFIIFSTSLFAQEQDSLTKKKEIVYRFNIRRDIGPAIWRQTRQAFSEAKELKVDYFVINMNTYGGAVVQADSIRTLILNAPMPVFVLIDNNAASAGALISIACDKIYMRRGASMGAATVVNQTGAAMPDKYQSYMRSIMRATSEAHGKDTIITANDTIIRWKRDPLIAEAMVDESLYLKGVIDTGKVLTLSPTEAIKLGFCDGMAENIQEMLKKEGVIDYELAEYRATAVEKTIGFLVNPIFQGLLIMLIIGGIYFELQTPGMGFPILASLVAAIIYFAPLYLEGLAANYEIIIFLVGILLLALEVFVIPGFGVAGVLGIIGIVGGLSLAMVDNYGFNFQPSHVETLLRAIGIVFISSIASLFLSYKLTLKAVGNKSWAFALHSTESIDDGYIGVDISIKEIVGKEGIAQSDLRPAGKIVVDEEVYDAMSIHSAFIPKGSKVKVIKFETAQLYVEKI